MADGVIRVVSNPDPSAPGIDNTLATNDQGQQVFRQRVHVGNDVQVKSAISQKIAEGKGFIAGAAINAGGALGTDVPCFRVHNPPSSTKVLYVYQITLYTDVTQQILYYEDATLNAPTTITPINRNRASHRETASVAVIQYGSKGVVGGSQWSNQSRIYSTSPVPIRFDDGPLPIRPGASIVLRGTSSSSQITTANAYYYEE